MTSDAVWRWNVDDIWQSYSSMYRERHSVDSATNDIERYHHLSASLLFGGCALESFLNTQMRVFLEHSGCDERKIFKALRHTPLRGKAREWASQIGSSDISDADITVIFEFLELRNEVTHRKRRDHSLYKELDEAEVSVFLLAIRNAFLNIYTGLGHSYPYWLLGWNFVGMNNDETHPCLLNNAQFKHALRHMGFDVPAFDYYAAEEWERKHMKTVEGFGRVVRQIYQVAPEIEPRSAIFPTAPRLCKRWWDKALITRS